MPGKRHISQPAFQGLLPLHFLISDRRDSPVFPVARRNSARPCLTYSGRAAYLDKSGLSNRMNREDLRKIGAGFYVDDRRSLYFNVREFLTANGLPDTAEMRQAVWDQVVHDFGVIGITQLTDE
jgi:hypothetical protein